MTAMLTLYRGLPGSGKTTAASLNVMADYRFEADDYFSPVEGGYWFDATRLHEAHKWCLWRTTEALRRGFRVTVANTFTRISEMQPYLDLGYPTTVIRCTGRYGSVHNVSEDTIDSMKWRFQDYEGEILV